MREPSLRERKKEATRLALHEAAVRLALDCGIEHLTVEAIAEAAEVSRRTFSNHFSSTEQALVYGDVARVLALFHRLREQPTDEPVWTSLTRVVLEVLPQYLDTVDPDEIRRRQLRAHPALAPFRAAAYSTFERELAAEIGGRLTGGDVALRSRVLAASFLAAVRVALFQWNTDPSRSRDELVAAALAAAAPAAG